MQVTSTRDDYQLYADFSELISKVSGFYLNQLVVRQTNLELFQVRCCHHKSRPSANFANIFAKKPSQYCGNQCTNLLPTGNK